MLACKGLKITPKGEVSVELYSPDEVVLNGAEMVTLLVHLKAYLSQDEMIKHFTVDEQRVIQRYYEQLMAKQEQLLSNYANKKSVRLMKRDFRDMLDWYRYAIEDSSTHVMSHVWGWDTNVGDTLPLVDRLIRALLSDTECTLETFIQRLTLLLSDPKLAKLSQETKELVQARYPDLDWSNVDKDAKKQRRSRKSKQK